MNKFNIKDYNMSIKKKNIKISIDELQFNSNEFVLLEGDNGVGKTTLINTLKGCYSKKIVVSGEMTINEIDSKIKRNSNNKIIYMKQADNFFNIYPLDELVLLAVNSKKISKTEALKEANDMFDEYCSKTNKKDFRKTKISKLSGGQKKILNFLCTMIQIVDNSIIFCDEPLNNLDDDNMIFVSNYLNKITRTKQNLIMILITHCKIFPFVTTILEVENQTVIKKDSKQNFTACFGTANSEGYYEV